MNVKATHNLSYLNASETDDDKDNGFQGDICLFVHK